MHKRPNYLRQSFYLNLSKSVYHCRSSYRETHAVINLNLILISATLERSKIIVLRCNIEAIRKLYVWHLEVPILTMYQRVYAIRLFFFCQFWGFVYKILDTGTRKDGRTRTQGHDGTCGHYGEVPKPGMWSVCFDTHSRILVKPSLGLSRK